MKLESTVAAIARTVDTNVLLWKVLEATGEAIRAAVMSLAVWNSVGDIFTESIIDSIDNFQGRELSEMIIEMCFVI